MATAEKRKDKAKKRVVTVEAVGEVHIKATFNNIIIAMTNTTGQVVSWASAGKMGFKGSKKNTPYAAQMAAQDCATKAYEQGLVQRTVIVEFDSLAAANAAHDGPAYQEALRVLGDGVKRDFRIVEGV